MGMGIFQGGSLSPLLFGIANENTHSSVTKAKATYDVGLSNASIDHLFVDDRRAKKERRVDSHVRRVRVSFYRRYTNGVLSFQDVMGSGYLMKKS